MASDQYRSIADVHNLEHDETSESKKVLMSDESGEPFNVQNPLPTDGDSVYAKDLIIATSDPGDFIITGQTSTKEEILTSMVSNVEIEKKNDTLDNPKSVLLKFKRPVVTSSFGIDSGPNGTFSNVKLTVYQGQNSQVIIDESADNTKHVINLFSTAPTKFDKILIEFHTTDTITTGLFGIFKSIETESTLRALNPSGEVVNIDATAGGNLKVSVEENNEAISKDIEGKGDLTIGTSQSEIVITGTPTQIRIRADKSNTGIIFIGKTGVLSDGTNDFVRLESADEIIMEYNDETNALYAISDTASQKINVGAIL